METKSSAFVKGGFGCLLAFLIVGLLFVLFGGHMHIDLGGACLLFVIGGVIGWIFLAVFQKGYQSGRRDSSLPHPDEGDEATERFE